MEIAMTAGTGGYDIERFGTRVDWCIRNLEPDERVVKPQAGVPLGLAIQNRTDLWNVIIPMLGRGAGKSNKTWNRCVSPTKRYPIPEAIIRALCLIYPEIPIEILLTRSFDEFQTKVEHLSNARRRWCDATDYVSDHRAALADLGKQYHRPVDEVPGFPLIAKKEWLLPQPVELTEQSPLPEFWAHVKDASAPRLDGMNVDYSSLVTRTLGRSRLRWNGDSYRMIDIQAKAENLKFVFGPTNYFSYVNSLETIALELADHCLRSGPDLLPELLPRRGQPSAIFDLKNRSAFAGVNCILLLKNYFVGVNSDQRRRSSNKFVLHDRPGDAVEARNTIHVVPAGGHQPLSVDFGDDQEVSIWRTAVREFCEELFNKEEAAELKRHGEDFLSLTEIQPLIESFFRGGAAKIYLLGVGLDPLTTKPEILVAIVANWAKASEKMELKIEENYEGNAQFYDLSRENLLREANKARAKKSLLPAGKACLLLAAENYDFLINQVQ
jgi:hypothetical protein